MLLRDKLKFWIMLSNYVDMIVGPAVSPLSLPDAYADSLSYVKAFGGCEQSDTPTPSDPVDIVCNNGALKARYSNGLPLTYQPLEYVSYNGAALSSGIDGFDDATSEIYLEWKTDSTSVSSDYQGVFVVWSANTYNSWRMLTYLKQTDKYYCYGNSRSPATVSNIEIDTWHTIECKSGNFKIDDNTYNTTVTSSLTPSDIALKIGSSANLNSYYKYIKIKRQGEWIANFVPAKRLSDDKVGLYDVINDVFKTSTAFTAGPAASIPVEVYADGTQETIAIIDSDNTTVSTATCEYLLSVGTSTDEQEVISGAVTRKVGVKVLDGTENWILSGVGVLVNFQSIIGGAFDNTAMICSHSTYAGGGVSVANMNQNEFSSYTNGNIAFKNANTTSTSDWTTFLTQQFEAGTPVIVVYPLATATTESVTAQPMSTAEGDNTAEITQASMSGLELEVKYKKQP